jgi:hypothetical protein
MYFLYMMLVSKISEAYNQNTAWKDDVLLWLCTVILCGMPECRKKHGLLPSFLVILSILVFSLYSLQEVAITKLQGEYTVDLVKWDV